MVLSSARLGRMREVAERTMVDSCAIRRQVEASDGQGGTTATWSTVATVACRVAPVGRTPAERTVAEQVQADTLWTVTLPAETDVRPSDRIVSDERTYHVVKALHRTYEIERRVICEKSS